ncbi:hypothetical protein [Alicyclobacillus fastidiosus]|uniref:Uncharacterized protein n=1 Tax=Alicyclobacillus fastidiosus TaxID=392011 RepID=A0ABV5AKB3_9BACL|nr:hypothetical protein [Alicyclobacillus fastidiosus]WEH09294.1 hypothetical protein PYS47_21900 [Alicyclobacillus fastidiosus]
MPTPTEINEHVSSLVQAVERGDLEFAILRVGETDIVLKPRSEMDESRD